MKRIEFLEKLNKHQKIVIEMEGQNNSKIFMENIIYSIKDDRLYLRNNVDLNFVVINLNIIREIFFDENMQEANIYLEDEYDTKIKISAI